MAWSFSSTVCVQDACADLISSNTEHQQRADSVQAQLRKVVDSIHKDKQEDYIKVSESLSLSLCAFRMPYNAILCILSLHA